MGTKVFKGICEFGTLNEQKYADLLKVKVWKTLKVNKSTILLGQRVEVSAIMNMRT